MVREQRIETTGMERSWYSQHEGGRVPRANSDLTLTPTLEAVRSTVLLPPQLPTTLNLGLSALVVTSIFTIMPYLTDSELADFANTHSARGCCASCRYWQNFDYPSHEGSVIQYIHYKGSCQRYAPRHIVADVDNRKAVPNYSGDALWPDTEWDEYCGEYTVSDNGPVFEWQHPDAEASLCRSTKPCTGPLC
jgi:hypothetical protein